MNKVRKIALLAGVIAYTMVHAGPPEVRVGQMMMVDMGNVRTDESVTLTIKNKYAALNLLEPRSMASYDSRSRDLVIDPNTTKPSERTLAQYDIRTRTMTRSRRGPVTTTPSDTITLTRVGNDVRVSRSGTPDQNVTCVGGACPVPFQCVLNMWDNRTGRYRNTIVPCDSKEFRTFKIRDGKEDTIITHHHPVRVPGTETGWRVDFTYVNDEEAPEGYVPFGEEMSEPLLPRQIAPVALTPACDCSAEYLRGYEDGLVDCSASVPVDVLDVAPKVPAAVDVGPALAPAEPLPALAPAEPLLDISPEDAQRIIDILQLLAQ